MECNQNCNQGRTCPGCNGAKPPVWTWIVTWIIIAASAAAICLAMLGTAEAKQKAKAAEAYNQKVRCLAEAVYHEARGESYRGKLAVAQTVLNRVKSSKFPNHICTVIFQKGQFTWTTTWNRSWSADYDSVQIARLAMMGSHSMKDFKALYFHNTSVNPGWKRKKLATIGNHVFYL